MVRRIRETVRFRDGNPEFEQLAMNAGRAPERVGDGHPENQFPDFYVDRWSTWIIGA